MKRLLPALIALFLTATLTGCIEIKQEMVLNPDGSGKVILESVFSTGAPLFMEENSPDLETRMKKAVAKEMEKAEGVDAWKDVRYTMLPDGRMKLNATAYFKSANKLKLYLQGFKGPLNTPRFETTPQGLPLMKFIPGGDKAKKKNNRPDINTLKGQALKDRLLLERADYQNLRPLLRTMFQDMKMSTVVRFPAPIKSTVIMKKTAPNVSSLSMEGEHMFKVLEKTMNDDKYLGVVLGQGFNMAEGPQGEDLLTELLFGQPGDPQVILQGAGKPQFDYEKEAAAARQQTAELLKKLNVAEKAKEVSLAPAAAGGLASAEVAGVRRVFKADTPNSISPFGQGEGLTLAVWVKFPGSVLKAQKAVFEKAVADNGDDLLPESEWQREASFLYLSVDKSATLVEIPLRAPGPKVKSISHILAKVIYQTGVKTTPTNLGFGKLAEGEKGKVLGAVLEKVTPKEEGKVEVELKLASNMARIKEVRFLNGQGELIKVSATGNSSWDENTTFYFQIDAGGLPENGSIVADIYDDLKSIEAPFSLRDLDLNGLPLK